MARGGPLEQRRIEKASNVDIRNVHEDAVTRKKSLGEKALKAYSQKTPFIEGQKLMAEEAGRQATLALLVGIRNSNYKGFNGDLDRVIEDIDWNAVRKVLTKAAMEAISLFEYVDSKNGAGDAQARLNLVNAEHFGELAKLFSPLGGKEKLNAEKAQEVGNRSDFRDMRAFAEMYLGTPPPEVAKHLDAMLSNADAARTALETVVPETDFFRDPQYKEERIKKLTFNDARKTSLVRTLLLRSMIAMANTTWMSVQPEKFASRFSETGKNETDKINPETEDDFVPPDVAAQQAYDKAVAWAEDKNKAGVDRVSQDTPDRENYIKALGYIGAMWYFEKDHFQVQIPNLEDAENHLNAYHEMMEPIEITNTGRESALPPGTVVQKLPHEEKIPKSRVPRPAKPKKLEKKPAVKKEKKEKPPRLNKSEAQKQKEREKLRQFLEKVGKQTRLALALALALAGASVPSSTTRESGTFKGHPIETVDTRAGNAQAARVGVNTASSETLDASKGSAEAEKPIELSETVHFERMPALDFKEIEPLHTFDSVPEESATASLSDTGSVSDQVPESAPLPGTDVEQVPHASYNTIIFSTGTVVINITDGSAQSNEQMMSMAREQDPVGDLSRIRVLDKDGHLLQLYPEFENRWLSEENAIQERERRAEALGDIVQ